MVKDVLIWPVLQTHGSTVLSVSVPIQEIDACHGNYLMVKNVYISKTNVPKEQNGTESHALLFLETVPMVSIPKNLNANHSHKDAFLPQFGMEINVFLMVPAHMELLLKTQVVNHTPHAQTAKVGIQAYFNVYAQKEQDGMEKSVLYVLVVRCGMHLMDALAPKATSWLDRDVRNPPQICAG